MEQKLRIKKVNKTLKLTLIKNGDCFETPVLSK